MSHPHNPVCEVCTKMERERIIKLLEDNQVLKETKLKKWLFAQGFRFAIVLIKGDKNE